MDLTDCGVEFALDSCFRAFAVSHASHDSNRLRPISGAQLFFNSAGGIIGRVISGTANSENRLFNH